ncbi:plasmid replication protein RepC [Rhizobium helianthi]|uniref:Plasmid replication protein RepC n=1 Tax=Rhizobium helianthi TaxID=1132695 RepID=A0ABW4M2N3_9HYPH
MQSDKITTPFGRRSMTLALVKRQMMSAETKASLSVDKWKVYRDICEAREKLGLQHRALAVLNALLSFFPDSELKPDGMLVVFPSNAQLSARSHGICSRTLRRNLAALTEAGVIERHDSPNGKRYAHRNKTGSIEIAFGFSLEPLLKRAHEFAEMAEQVAEQRMQLKRSKDMLSLCRRDIRKLIAIGNLASNENSEARLDSILAQLPRTANLAQIESVLRQLQVLKEEVINTLKKEKKLDVLSVSDGHNVRHIEESESESLPESENGEALNAERMPQAHEDNAKRLTVSPSIPLDMVLRACPEIINYSPQGIIRTWHDLASAASLARSMLGISSHTYHRSVTVMGPMNAAIVLAGMLEKLDSIQSPAAYLCDLSKRAERQGFSPVPLVMSLLRAKHMLSKTSMACKTPDALANTSSHPRPVVRISGSCYGE